MRAFAQKPKAAQLTAPAKSALPGRARLGHRCEAGSILPASVGHDFSRIPVFGQQGSEGQQAVRASGEMAEGPEEEWPSITGDGGSGAPAPGAVAAAPRAAAATPKLKKTTVTPLSTQNNGGFKWGVQWAIDNATTSTNGWIVQHVVVTQAVEAWHPPLLPGATMPIVPGQTPWGGLSTSWYPLWEAWQVRGGAVFVGGGTAAHSADTYGQGPVGASTKGTTKVVGKANFYPNLTLPAAFTVRNAAPAWALPATNTAPALTGGTGALDHNLTATWDGVAGTGATTATTV